MLRYSSTWRVWRQQLSTVVGAVAIGASLMIYQQIVLADPDQVVQQHWQAIATDNAEVGLARYDKDAVLMWVDGVQFQRFQGKAIPQAWDGILQQYTIESTMITDSGDRWIKGKVVLTQPHPVTGVTRRLTMQYEAALNGEGRIVQEVWRHDPRFNL